MPQRDPARDDGEVGPGSYVYHMGARIHWRVDGDEGAPSLVLLNSIGTNLGTWDACVDILKEKYHVLRMDTRGHGRSDAPDGDYALSLLSADVFAVMDAAGIARAIVAGVSLGGMMAMQMALDAPHRLNGLVLICTSATMDAAAWADRISTVRSGGTAAIADFAMARFFSEGFLKTQPGTVFKVRQTLADMSDQGYGGASAAIRDMQIIDRLGEIDVPTRLIAGDDDVSTPFEPHGRAICNAMRGVEVIHLRTGHLAQLEDPRAVAAEICRAAQRNAL